MASSLRQGLQSCLEPQLVEPRVLRLKLAKTQSDLSPIFVGNQENNTTNKENKSNKSNFDDCKPKNQKNDNLGSWSFLQSLTNSTESPKQPSENEKVYVHPLVKLSSSKLSKKSLEMCTESLGSETGSNISESGDDNLLSLSSESTPTFFQKQRSRMRETSVKKNWPPPLTSISGSDYVRVRPHREGGRLVLQAVSVSASHTYFRAERSDGRLTLRLLTENLSNEAPAQENEKATVEEDDIEGEDDEVDCGDYSEEEDDEDFLDWDEDMNGNSENVGGEIGIENLPRPSRCNESGHENKGMWNLGAACWVTT